MSSKSQFYEMYSWTSLNKALTWYCPCRKGRVLSREGLNDVSFRALGMDFQKAIIVQRTLRYIVLLAI